MWASKVTLMALDLTFPRRGCGLPPPGPRGPRASLPAAGGPRAGRVPRLPRPRGADPRGLQGVPVLTAQKDRWRHPPLRVTVPSRVPPVVPRAAAPAQAPAPASLPAPRGPPWGLLRPRRRAGEATQAGPGAGACLPARGPGRPLPQGGRGTTRPSELPRREGGGGEGLRAGGAADRGLPGPGGGGGGEAAGEADGGAQQARGQQGGRRCRWPGS